ncbi:hypothetical protein PR048_017755 [Dryococelus australis]|uniref:Transposable element P transposase-like RNase H domain-containing protein n=1 Tax=Dryococelus australis TaxID=614101 RepID=A0ABQ9HAC9_9NEOP|nr:hypothetical protein PR048_017755 [Dryococelus australis]
MKKSRTEETSAQPPAENDVPPVLDDPLRKLQEHIQELESQKETFSLRENLETLELSRSKDVELKVEEILYRYFTPKNHISWSPEDIAAAIYLKSVSSKAYRYLCNKLKYPLPDMSTLRKLARESECDVAKAKDLGEFEKISFLSFDEVKISSDICVDRKAGQILGPHKLAQVVMARSLLGKWKHPIYYDFDRPMPKQILKNIIAEVQGNGFQVVAVVNDMGGGNRAAWKQLGINTEKTHFPNPNDHTKKFSFLQMSQFYSNWHETIF